jgi:lipoprotein-releasing system permease protein
MILSRYERMIARRYLLPGKGEAFIFLVASISLVAVMLGVAALIIVMSVMNGFRAELFDKVVGLNGHAVVQGYGGRLPDWRDVMQQAKATPGVTAAVPLIEQPLMASYEGRVEGVLVRGMRRQDILSNPTLQGKVLAGSLADLEPDPGGSASAPGWRRRSERRSADRSRSSARRDRRHPSALSPASSIIRSPPSSKWASTITTRRSW